MPEAEERGAEAPPTSRTLERLLRALPRPTLLRVARAFDLEASTRSADEELIQTLLGRREVDPAEVVRKVLRQDELRPTAAALGVPTQGTAHELRQRLARGLRWRPFAEARELARGLGLNTVKEWRAWVKSGACPPDVPHTPHQAYAELGWEGYGDWLGTGRFGVRGRSYRPFQEARRFVCQLGLRNTEEYYAWCRGDRPDLPPRTADIPVFPHRMYPGEWQSMGDWLGTGTVAKQLRLFRPLPEVQVLARQLGLRTRDEWYAWARGERPDLPPRPDDVPTHPERSFEDEWTTWGEFLGTGTVASVQREFRSFHAARAFARQLGLASFNQWTQWCTGDLPGLPSRPLDIPSNPQRVYRAEGWASWGDWLGTGTISTRDRECWDFERSRALARSLELRSQGEWRAWAAGRLAGKPPRPPGVPFNPWRSYADQWKGWNDWLGKPERRWRPFEEARAFARSLGLRGEQAWKAWAAGRRPDLPPKPPDIPASPGPIYRDLGWAGFADWLGH